MINFSRHYTAEQIIKATADYDSVSFDVFDTLVKRCVAVPSDVFVRTAKDYCVNYGMGGGHTLIDPVKFKQDRQNAEHLAHTKLTSREEVSLDEIYDNLPEEYSHCKDKLKALEIEREIKCCRANPVMKQVYDWCREHNKRILIISDMYLPVNAVREILSVCGYDGYERLYLSSDVGLKKSSGRLFRFAIQDSGINTKRHIHIGDAWRGDYLRALQAGISASKIVRHPVRSKYAKTMGLKREHRAQYEKYQRVINNHVAPDWDEYYQYGFEVVGLMLYGLCCWLHERFTENKHDKVFFLSRDGYLMQEAYNKLFGERAVKNSYLYVSRNSLLMPRIWINPSLDNILDFVTTFEYLDLNQLCDILDIDTAKVYDVWEKCGLGRNESMPKKQFIHDERVNAFFEHFKGEIVMKSREKFSVLTEYLKQEGFYGNVAVVDIGWAGSMQRFLGECLKQANIDVQIYGYYLSMTPHIAVNASEAEGYIPVKLNPKLSCTALIEYPFTKIAGSTETYALKEDGTVWAAGANNNAQFSVSGRQYPHVQVHYEDGSAVYAKDISGSSSILQVLTP